MVNLTPPNVVYSLYLSLNDTFDKNKKYMLITESHSKDKKCAMDKANIGNPKVNRGCVPLTANSTLADCVKNSFEPSVQYIPPGV